MTEWVVLASKVYVDGDARDRTLRSLEGLLEDRLAGLDVAADVSLRDDGFPDVELTGDDATAAANLLAEEFGAIPEAFEPGETYVGTLESWDDDGLVLDAGREFRVPADGLGLGQGTPSQVRERFGLVQHLPMQFVYGVDAAGEANDEAAEAANDGAADGANDGAADGANGSEPDGADDGAADGTDVEQADDGDDFRIELADAERDRLYDWQRGPGRVNVNSATRSEVRATLNRAGHARDVVTVERLGLLEQSVVCREGTDPPGLIASIGDYLPAELRAVV